MVVILCIKVVFYLFSVLFSGGSTWCHYWKQFLWQHWRWHCWFCKWNEWKNSASDDIENEGSTEEIYHDPITIDEEKNPKVSEFWNLKNNPSYPYVIVQSIEPEEDLIGVKYFKSSSKCTGVHFKNEELFIICITEMKKKVALPLEKQWGKRTFYYFEEEKEMAWKTDGSAG